MAQLRVSFEAHSVNLCPITGSVHRSRDVKDELEINFQHNYFYAACFYAAGVEHTSYPLQGIRLAQTMSLLNPLPEKVPSVLFPQFQ